MVYARPCSDSDTSLAGKARARFAGEAAATVLQQRGVAHKDVQVAASPRAEGRLRDAGLEVPAANSAVPASRGRTASSPMRTGRVAEAVRSPQGLRKVPTPAHPHGVGASVAFDGGSLGRLPVGPRAQDEVPIDLSSHVMTDAALLKSQLLLDQLLSSGLFDEDAAGTNGTQSHCSSAAETEDPFIMGAEVDAFAPLTSLPFAKTATTEVPVEFLTMLAEMWQQIKNGQPAVEHLSPASDMESSSMSKLPLASEVSPGSSTLAPSSLNSTMTSVCSTGCSVVTAPGVDSPTPTTMSTRITAEDKAQLIKELREALCTGLPSKDMNVARSPQLSLTPSAPRLVHLHRASAPVLPQLVRQVHGACPVLSPLPPAAPRGGAPPLAPARSLPQGRPGPAAPSPRAASPSHVARHPSMPQARRMSWQKVAVTSIHQVLTAC